MRRSPIRFRTALGLAVLGLLGAHMAMGHGSYGLQSNSGLEADNGQADVRSSAPTAPLVRAFERRDEEIRAARYLSFEPRHVDTRWRELRIAAEGRAQPSPAAQDEQQGDAREWARVTASSLNMRTEARVGSDRITSYPAGTRLLIRDRSGNWMQVEHPDTGQVGWMSSRFLDVTTQSADTAAQNQADPGA